MKKVDSHGDHQEVLLVCKDEKIGYHSGKCLSKSIK